MSYFSAESLLPRTGDLTYRQTDRPTIIMTDFDAIYHEQVEEGSAILDETNAALVPDPVIVRGAGNITV
jgi:hypothetical protein